MFQEVDGAFAAVSLSRTPGAQVGNHYFKRSGGSGRNALVAAVSELDWYFTVLAANLEFQILMMPLRWGEGLCLVIDLLLVRLALRADRLPVVYRIRFDRKFSFDKLFFKYTQRPQYYERKKILQSNKEVVMTKN